jgi:hypothetical protein
MKRQLCFQTSSKWSFLFLISLLSILYRLCYADLTQDAVIITLRHQDGIHLDSTMAAEIDPGLAAARAEIDSLGQRRRSDKGLFDIQPGASPTSADTLAVNA